MYPSTKDPVYGTFIYSFVKEISQRNINGKTDIVVIKGRNDKKLIKIFKYIKFYILSFFKPLFHNYDLIYIHCLTFSPLSINLLSRIKKLPLAINVHGGDVLTRSSFAEHLKQHNRILLKKCRLIISPSYYFKKILIQEFPEIDKKRIFVSPSGGVDTSVFVPIPNSHKDYINIGFVSRIDEGKGWDVFINTVAHLKNSGHNIKAEIIGRGNQTSDLKKMIQNLSLGNTIRYIGPVKYKDLPQAYSRFDLFIFPTQLYESLGLVAIEAMSCGVPVIGSRIGGLEDYIIDGENGLFAKTGDSADYYKKIESYLALSDYEKKEMHKKARITALKYDTKQVFDELFMQLNKFYNT